MSLTDGYEHGADQRAGKERIDVLEWILEYDLPQLWRKLGHDSKCSELARIDEPKVIVLCWF